MIRSLLLFPIIPPGAHDVYWRIQRKRRAEKLPADSHVHLKLASMLSDALQSHFARHRFLLPPVNT
jgi:hypothetical protein